MATPASELEWTLRTVASSTRLFWRLLGPIEWSGLSIEFPADAPREPGIYLIRVTLGDDTRTYVGEAADLSRRLRRYSGRPEERPYQRGMTSTNMRGRLTRTFCAGGKAVIYLLQLPLEQSPARESLDPARKDHRIMIERLAISAAYLHGEQLINEEGFPAYPDGHPLQ